ncbi:MAG: C-terminal helicase domain-containing protein [Rubrivivax sp.]
MPAPPEAAPAPRTRARRGAGVDTPPAQPVAAAAAAPVWRALDGDVLFGRYAVELPDDEPAEVLLRDTTPGTAWCSCLDFALSEDARCAHVDAVWAARCGPDAVAADVRPPSSRVVLRHGARRRLLWLAGCECAPDLQERARALLADDDADEAALGRLLRAAREAGHPVQVDEAVWQHLAVARDLRARVLRLEALLPDGPSDAQLQALAGAPLLPLQAEGALFALCAGRCVLADCDELQPPLQALLALRLARRHFGVERVLVLAPQAALDGWRRRLQADGDGIALLALESLSGDAALHRSLAPQLLVLHEPDEGGLWVDADRAAALLRLQVPLAIVVAGAQSLQRAAEWPLRVAFVDAARQGAYAELLDRHGERDADGQLCGLQHLDGLRETLAPMLLARPFDEVRERLPERVDSVEAVTLPAAAREAEATLRQALAESWRRWQRSGWLSDQDQRALLAQLQDLRRLLAGVGPHEIAGAKADALRAWLEAAGPARPKAVAFGQWPQALRAVADHLAPLQPALWDAAEPQALRDAAVERFRSDPACRLLLVSDGGSVLDLRQPGLPVLHLDRPWNPRMLLRRFARVHRRGQAHLVPVAQLVLAGTLEQALADAGDARGELVAELPDAQPGDGFLQGDALAAFGQDLGRLLAIEA